MPPARSPRTLASPALRAYSLSAGLFISRPSGAAQGISFISLPRPPGTPSNRRGMVLRPEFHRFFLTFHRLFIVLHRPSSPFIASSPHPISHRKPNFLYLCTFKFGSIKNPQYEENFYRNRFTDAGLRLYNETRKVRCKRHRETRNQGPGRPFHP